ncbi:paired domain-containing protein [Trichonephila clavipes]|nr:paired domain-containing protein [Trichonephila clavipes]
MYPREKKSDFRLKYGFPSRKEKTAYLLCSLLGPSFASIDYIETEKKTHMARTYLYSCSDLSKAQPTRSCGFVDNSHWGLTMFERSRLPDSLRWRAVGWMKTRLSQADAARRPNVSRSVVHRLWNQYKTGASVSRIHVSGRP